MSPEHIRVTVNGEISGGDPGKRGWMVEILSVAPVARERSTLQDDGTFEFRQLTPPGTRAPEASETQTVSVREPQHKVPRKAMLERNKGVSALKQRQFSLAADHLQNAVAIDPRFARAHSDLGIAYFGLKEYDQSLEHLQRAIEPAPGFQPANENLCLLFLSLRRYAEAGQVADRVLKAGSNSAVANYAAAVSAIAAGGSSARVLEHLRRASDEIPKGHLLAARVLANTGRRTDAAHELEAYLQSPQTGSERPEVEAWLAELKQ